MPKRLIRIAWKLQVVVIAAAIWFALPSSLRLRIAPTVHAANFTVTNTNDDGPGSLRNAIVNANLNSSFANVINFNIPGSGVKTITLLSPLPTITHRLSIYAPFDSPYPFSRQIELNGSHAGAGAN